MVLGIDMFGGWDLDWLLEVGVADRLGDDGSRSARIPTSQNRDMGHPGFPDRLAHPAIWQLRDRYFCGQRCETWTRLRGAGEGNEADVVVLAEELGGVGQGFDGGGVSQEFGDAVEAE